jgi:protein-tyrosine phosphatase
VVQAGRGPVIDLHSHVLPGIDDGPADMSASVALAAAASRDGTATMAATPHLRPDFPNVRPEELAERCRSLAERLGAANVPIEIVSGAELDVRWATEASDDQLRLASFAQRGSDLLVESPYGPITPAFEDALLALAGRGYRIVLAHPERNPSFQTHPQRLERLVAVGVLLQVTTHAVASQERNSRSRWLAQGLVEHNMAHVIASDAHDANDRRPPTLSTAVAAARRLAPLRADWMVTDAPAAVLEGVELPPPPSSRSVRRGLFRRRR